MAKFPIYKISINDEFSEGGLDYVSLVADPAIQMKGLAFAEAKKFSFNEDRQIVAGPALIPDQLIYRFDEEIGEYYVVFDRETIIQLVAKFNKTPKEFKINVDHKDVVESAYIFSNWITDGNSDKSKSYGFDLPAGSWFVEVKIEDKKFWNEQVKGNEKFGFSVEGLFGISLSKQIKKITESENDSIEIKQNIEMEKEVTLKEIIVQLQAEIAELKLAAEVKEEEAVSGKTEEVIEEVVAEEVIEEAPVEVKEEAKIDEAAIMAIIQPALDEIYKAIAELKTEVDVAEEVAEGELPVAMVDKKQFNAQAKASFRDLFKAIDSYRK